MTAVALAQVAVHLRPNDNVAVAARDLPPGLQIDIHGQALTVARRVGLGHKLALRPIAQGEAVSKYGQVIGFASRDIAPGDHVHVHNVSADAFERDYAFCRDCPPPPAAAEPRYFMGYDRGADRPDPALRHAQLHRHHQHRQLLGQHEQVHLRALPRHRHPRAVSERGRRRRHHAQGRLRDAVRRARPPATRPHAGRLRPARQRRGLHPRRPRLRDRARRCT